MATAIMLPPPVVPPPAAAAIPSPPATPFAVVFDWTEEFGPFHSAQGWSAQSSNADNKAIAVGETERASARCLRAIADGACALDNPNNVTLPIIPDDPAGRYTPTREFVEAMVETFKNGGKMPKRVVWEIVLGVKAVVDAEASLVEIEVPKGVTCDIVGDSECRSGQFPDRSSTDFQPTANSTTCTTFSASSSRQATTTWSSSTATLSTAARGVSRSS